MVPAPARCGACPATAPRARGDGPVAVTMWSAATGCSPRTRGWSPALPHRRPRHRLLPAHAGMVPLGQRHGRRGRAAPRARGDGPLDNPDAPDAIYCSPRTRGWSPVAVHGAARVDAAPRARGDGPHTETPVEFEVGCSPRTRGWSLGVAMATGSGPLLPAHAGMVPVQITAGMAYVTAPRARGDGPSAGFLVTIAPGCSPRTRGWSPPDATLRRCAYLLPAHAGMVPTRRRSGRAGTPAPRARGDGPGGQAPSGESITCSPRTRGWSLFGKKENA